ncbi:MAG: efflux RND transporter periplasmic adaptor subunit [Actinobacteria bacterium]|nr:efflux RND transporter periplasmic adaptor subunit [Actinomycetota bacterium]
MGAVESSFDATGRIQPRAASGVVASVEGVVAEINAPNGSAVTRGVPVLSIATGSTNETITQVLAPATGIVQRLALAPGSPIAAHEIAAVVESTESVVAASIEPKRLYSFTERPLRIDARLVGEVASFPCDFVDLARSDSSASEDVTYKLRCAIPQSIRVVVGSRAELRIVTARADRAVTVPLTSLERNAAGSFVTRLVAGKRDRIAVTTGIASDRTIEIRSGLDEGDLVLDPPPSDSR